MMNKKVTKRALRTSVLCLLLCISMLIGTTYAWFTDAVTSGNNIIKSGNLDLKMYWSEDPESGIWHDVEDPDHNTVFSYDLWEPGYTQVRYIKLVNEGSLALNYSLSLTPESGVGKLAEVINVYFDPYGKKVESRDDLKKMGTIGLLHNVLNGGATADGTLLPAGEQSPFHPSGETVMALAMNMLTTAGNEYQNESCGDFSITALATQASYETDSFGADYDSAATFPLLRNGRRVSAPVNPVNGKVPEGGLKLEGDGLSVFVPAGTPVKEGAKKITVTVTPLEESDSGLTAVNNEVLIPVDIHAEGIDAGNTLPLIIDLGEILPKHLNMGNYRLFHVENGTNNEMTLVDGKANLTAHNRFTYDPLTGAVSVAMATFSEVAMVADTAAKWEGNIDVTWYDASKSSFEIANADQFVGLSALVGGMTHYANEQAIKGASNTHVSFEGKTIKLLSDLNLNGGKATINGIETQLFYPVGYYNTEYSYAKTGEDIDSSFNTFKGTFDGNGHTITNIYHNTWEMKGDHDWYSPEEQYYRDGMGLFGRVYRGTVKNLTVDHFESDGEIATTGCIAAYADGATFENIAITNCKPRVYNIGNGGIVGCVGWYAKEKDLKTTFKNITVDNSNTISALWGSYDVPCGGIVGQYYPTSGQTSAGTPKNAGIHFENCHAAAQMDVNNDVCGNYQYYAYRYAGMLIGSVRENETKDGHVYPKMDGITAEDCTVHFGTWNDYYYCEFEKNGHPSYSGPDDYKFSRVPHSELNFTDSDGNKKIDTIEERNSVTGCKHVHTAAEDNQAVYLPFNNLVTGYGWGVTTKVVGDMKGVTILDREEANSVEKFETKFTGDFLYRVGNENAVSVGSLFKYKDSVAEEDRNGSSVWVSVESVYENSTVNGTFTPSKTNNWEDGTIVFSNTGVVKVTIQDYNFCTPTVIYLEVVDATNVTKATSATSDSIVLLNNVSGSFSVSNNHTLYGNGFTVTLPTSYEAKSTAGFVGYITMNNGNLDNVRIEGPVYPVMNIYQSQSINNETQKEEYFYNSILINGGNCTISNSYISGSRTAVCIRGGNNVVVENTTLSGGAFANMQVAGVNSLVLRDLTTVQEDVTDSYGKGVTAHGMGIYVDSAVANITVEGSLNQYNWLSQTQWKSIVGTYESFFPAFFSDSKFEPYQGKRDNTTYVNIAFVFACDWNAAKLNVENQTSKLPYQKLDGITIKTPEGSVTGGVYSVVNQKTVTDDMYYAPSYKSTGYNPVAPTFDWDNSVNHDDNDDANANDSYCVYNQDTGVMSIGLTGNKTLNLSGVSITKGGAPINYTAYLNGNKISGNTVTITADAGTTQTLTFNVALDGKGYDKNGNVISGNMEYVWNVTLEVATLSYPAPEWAITNNKPGTANCYYVYYTTSKGYGEAVPIYDGIVVKYYDRNGVLQTKDFSNTIAELKGKGVMWNLNTELVYEVDGCKLTMKVTGSFKSGVTGLYFTTYDNKTYVYPADLKSDSWVRPNKTSYAFNVSVEYTFTDPHGLSTPKTTVNWYADAGKPTNTCQWKDFDSDNGSEACVTPDTLVTLADGSQKRIDAVTYEDELLVWDFYKGNYAKVPSAIIFDHGYGNNTVIKLNFSDGTEVKVVNLHQFFDTDLNKLVTIDESSVAGYLGHRFAKQGKNGCENVLLVDYEISKEYVEAFGIISAGHYNIFVEGMLSADFMPEDMPLFTYFEVDEDMKYDQAKMAADIAAYGVYTYEEFADYLTYEQFMAFNVPYMKVAVGKGTYTYEGILALIEFYLKA